MPIQVLKQVGNCVMLIAAIWLYSTVVGAAPMDTRDIVTDQRGQVVVNTFGNCVRTQWSAGTDICGPQPKQAMPAPQPRAQIAYEARTVYFPFNRADIPPGEQRKLDSLANILKQERSIRQVSIVGYADRMGNADYNILLSRKRAEGVEKYLHRRGYLNTEIADTRWLGESMPTTRCPEGLPRNELIACLQNDRRVEVEIQYLENDNLAARR